MYDFLFIFMMQVWSVLFQIFNGRGCKFSAEEESVVIELQKQFGNKWAKIAACLEGRTDNDVKNFWSSRRKRLERTLARTPSPPFKQQKNKGKDMLILNNNQVKVEKVTWTDFYVLCKIVFGNRLSAITQSCCTCLVVQFRLGGFAF